MPGNDRVRDLPTTADRLLTVDLSMRDKGQDTIIVTVISCHRTYCCVRTVHIYHIYGYREIFRAT
jgi:hypothetical protein